MQNKLRRSEARLLSGAYHLGISFECCVLRQRASVRKFYMYYCSIIRLIDNVSMGTSKSKHLVVQFTENLKEREHNMCQ